MYANLKFTKLLKHVNFFITAKPKNVMKFNETITNLAAITDDFKAKLKEGLSKNPKNEMINSNIQMLTYLKNFLEDFKKLDPQVASSMLSYLKKNGSVVLLGLVSQSENVDPIRIVKQLNIGLVEYDVDMVMMYKRMGTYNYYLSEVMFDVLRVRGYSGDRVINCDLYLNFLDQLITEFNRNIFFG